ncbi:MAG: hypothetical protein WB495_02430 [Xanthobacteraceae bacterium]
MMLGGGYVFLRTVRMFFAAYGAVPDYLWLGLVLPPLFLGFGVVLLVFGDQLTPDEPRFLVEFVARTIEAVEV